MKNALIYQFCFIFTFMTNTQEQPNHNIEYLFAHGLKAGKQQINKYKEIIPIEGKGLAFDFIDVLTPPLYPGLIKIPPTAFGQERDITVLTDAIKNINVPIVGIGVSKGAACWINAAAYPENIDKISALILESPFANVNEIIHKFKFIDYLNYIPGGKFIAKHGAKKILCHYDPHGIQPIDSINKISNKNLPIFLIHSKQDKLIPINHARRLYKKFIKNNFTNVYLIETDAGHHAGIIYTDPAKTFQKTLNSFYKKFNLPYDYDIELIDIDQYKPTIEEIDKRITNDTNLFDEYKPVMIKIIITLLIAYMFLKRYL